MPDEEGVVACDVCGAHAPNKCSACKQVAYCTKEHQKQDWKRHKEVCRPFVVCSSPEMGRHLLASRDLTPGDVILSELPLVVGPKHHSQDEAVLCLLCHRPASLDTDYRCPRCLWPVCGPDCPGDAKTHAHECVVLRVDPQQSRRNVTSQRGYHYEAITPLRCLLQQRRSPRKWRQILEMEAHEGDRGPGTDAYSREVRERVVGYLKTNFLDKLPESGAEPLLEDTSEKTLLRLCGVLDVNALELSLPFGTEVVALYPSAYLLEHSCVPNTRHSFETAPGTRQYRVTVTAARGIRRGEHITTMYTHALWGTQARREHLKATKYFSCRCQRCADPTELGTFVSAMKCLGANSEGTPCGGIQLPLSPLEEDSDWKCDRCPITLSSSQVNDLVTRIGDEVENILRGGPTVKQLEELLDKVSTFLHPNHYHCYAIKHSLVQLYGHQHGYKPQQLTLQQLDKKYDMCRGLLTTTETLDPGNARLALYSSVLQYETHNAVVQSARRRLSQQPPGIGREELASKVKEARHLLVRAGQALAPEPELSAGGRMLCLVDKSLKELDIWVKELGLSGTDRG
uniref:Protein msta n=1 Tax=Timema shepardi TaxID=629360 RepID=A0A7R9B0G8_TIMSH|nr:unnamed protein product [Timema shepardi]